MLKNITMICAIFGALAFTGCASTSPVQGSLFADVSGPIAATARPRGGKSGEACAQSFFGLIAMGDASITAASKAGGIKVISHVEQKTKNIIGFNTFCTVVWGK
jgi:hypothetical protein